MERLRQKFGLKGRQDVRLDDKKRFLIPSEFFEDLKKESLEGLEDEASEQQKVPEEVPQEDSGNEDGKKGKKTKTEEPFSVVVAFGTDSNLCIFPPLKFEKMADEVEKQSHYDAEWADMMGYIIGNAVEMKVDKTRRIRIPNELMELAGLEKDVTIIMRDHVLVLHDKDEYVAKMSPKIQKRIREKSSLIGAKIIPVSQASNNGDGDN